MNCRNTTLEQVPALLRVLRGETLSTPPIWLMRQAGRYLPEYRELRARAGTFLDLVYNPALAAEVTMQPIRRFGFDGAVLFSDILVVPHALGQDVAFREGEGPVLDAIGEDWPNRLRQDAFAGRIAPVLETVERVRALLPQGVALIGFCGAPWTVATYMIAGRGTPDQAPARVMAYTRPEAFGALIELLVEVSVEYLSRQIEAGAHAVKIFDSWSGNLPEDQFRCWCLEPARRMTALLKARHPDVPVIGFPRGAGPLYRNFAGESGVDAVACDTTLPVAWVARELQSRLPVQGLLDPLLLVAGGDALRQRVGDILSVLSSGPFVFNLGHGILPETPVEHVSELVALVRRGG